MCVRECVRKCVRMCACAYVCMCVCVQAHMYVYIRVVNLPRRKLRSADLVASPSRHAALARGWSHTYCTHQIH